MVGRKVFERGFWKSGEERKAELEVLEMVEGKALTDGTNEDDDGDYACQTSSSGSRSDLVSRWVRIIRCGINIAGAVDGSRDWNVEGKLAEKVIQWKEEDRTKKRRGEGWVGVMDVDDNPDVEDDSVSEESEDDEKEVKASKVSFFCIGRSY